MQPPTSTTVPGTSLVSTRLGFGTASLHRLYSSRARRSLLAAAFDNGIRHFDCARYYGHGLAERELGRFARSVARENLIIASKVGIHANALFERIPLLMYAAKAAGLARHARHISYAAGEFERQADRSLHATLAASRLDYVDLLLLHEPPTSLTAIAGYVTDWFIRVRERGYARHVGIAGEAANVTRLQSSAGSLAEVLQISDSLESDPPNFGTNLGRPPQITFGYFRTARNATAAEIVRGALRRNSGGVVLFSTTRMEHLNEVCAASRLAN